MGYDTLGILVGLVGGGVFFTWLFFHVRSHDREFERLRDHEHYQNAAMHRMGLMMELLLHQHGLPIPRAEDTPPSAV